MCGICGIINKNGEKVNIGLIQEMLKTIHHRGPDAEGTYLKNNFAIGHKRLSIIDLSDAGNQPMHFQGRYSIVYNGEVYNYIELRSELLKQGYNFFSETDTEVIMAAYDCWGEDCLNKFNGMWAFAIYDDVKKILFCARDRFGIKPFYYFLNNDKFLFASEIKQILKVMPVAAKMNEDRVWDFLCNGITEWSDTTFFKDIKQLSAGTCGIFALEKNNWQVKKWYNIEKHHILNNYKKNVKVFKKTFLDSLYLRLRADVPIGACLSGGLDSSSIVCGISELFNNSVEIHTISSCFDKEEEKKYDEQEYIDEVIKLTNAVSHKIYVNIEDIFAKLDKIIWHMDEPFTTTSICAQWEVFEEAQRNNLTVMLDGQGADEQLAGYTGFYLPTFIEFLKKRKVIELYKAIKNFDKKRGKVEDICANSILEDALKNLFSNRKWWKILSKLKVYGKKKENKNDCGKKIPYPYPLNKGTIKGIYNINDFDQFTKDMIQVNLQALLHFEDRNSMAHSIETRVPFLDYRLVEAIYDMPAEHKIRNGYTKAVMRSAMKGILPEKIRLRMSKLGFATPEEVWIHAHQEYFRNELLKACKILDQIVEEKKVLEWFDYCIKNNVKDYFSFRIICLGRWVKIFNVKR